MSSKYVGIEDARKVLGDLVSAAQQGTDTILTRNGRPAARITTCQETAMTRMYTVQIQATDADQRIWQAMHPAETVTAFNGEDGEAVARLTTGNQDIAEGTLWRVAVWDGRDADTGVAPAYTHGPFVDIVELTKRLNRPDHQQSAILAWTGGTYGTVWTEAEADELQKAWEADQRRIDAEQG